jgi:hypothetical protein
MEDYMTQVSQPLADIDPAATYRVTLNEAVTVGQRRVTGKNVRLKGRILAETLSRRPSAISAYELV